jgi:WD40 repeat protein/DNA-binding SARP family transcriptional activator
LQPLAGRAGKAALPARRRPYGVLVRFGLLGPTEVVDDSRGRTVTVGGAVPRRVLTALLAQRGRSVPVDRLVLAVWGDEAPPSAERSLQSHVTRLRDVLGRDDLGARLTFVSGGYRFDVDPDVLDTTTFVTSIRSARQTVVDDPARAAAQVEEALALWRGQPYADLAATDYPSAEAASLEELRLRAQVDHADYLLAAGQAAVAVPELEALVAEHPFLEQAWELLVTALYRQGRQADALAAFRRARTALADELGVDPGPGLQAVEQQVLDHDAALLGPVPTGPVVRTRCPYKGLTGYETADAGLFVGRERLVEELVATLVDRRLLVLVGPSGAGKSSVLRAGLLPRLAEGAVTGSDRWTVRVVVPHEAPSAQVRAAIDDHPDLVVLDQAEAAWSDQVPKADREALAALLAAPGPGTRVVIAMRADFYGRLAEDDVLARLVGPATVLVGQPSADDLRRIVTEPARIVGLGVEPAVVDEIVAEIAGRPGVLPLLSTALVRLWEHRDGDRLTLAGYRRSGGVRAALERAGEDAWAGLADDEQRAAARRVLVRLARPEDDRWIARRVARAEVAPADDAAAQAAVELLCDRRLVVAQADTLVVAHEALFQGWPRLARWLADMASSRVELERLAAAAHDWSTEGREDAQLLRGARLLAATDVEQAHPDDVAALEHEYVEASTRAATAAAAAEQDRTRAALRSTRRTRALAAALAVALLLSLSAGVIAVRQARSANDAATTAQAGRIGAVAKDPTVPVDQALLLGAQAMAMHPGADEDSDLLAALSRSPALQAAARSPSRVLSVSASPDGRRVLTAGVGGQVVTWDPRTLREESTVTVPGGSAVYVAGGPGGRTVIGWQNAPPSVQVLDADGHELVRVDVPRSDVAPQVAVAGDWFAFVAGSDDSADTVELRRVDAPTVTVASVAAPGHVYVTGCGPAQFCLATDKGQLWLLAPPGGALNGPVDLTSTSGAGSDSGSVLAGATVTRENIGGVVGSPDGRLIALGGGPDGVIRVRSLPTGRLVRVVTVTPNEGMPLAFSADDRLLAAYADGVVKVWDVGSGVLVRVFRGHVAPVVTGTFSADGRTLYTASLDRQVLAWDLTGTASFVRTVSLGTGAAIGTVWATPDAVVVGLANGHLLFVHRPDGAVLRPDQLAGTDWLDTVRSGGDGTLLVASDLDGTVTVWDSTDGAYLGPVDLPPAQLVPDVWVSDDGVTAATVRSADGPLYLIDLRTRQVRTVRMHLPAGAVLSQVFRWTHDGHVVVGVDTAAGPVSEALLVDPRTGRVDHRVPLVGQPLEVAADPGGRWLVYAGDDGYLRFASIADGHQLAPPQIAVNGLVYNVSVSPDGRYVVTGGAPGQARLWDTTTFRQLGPDLPAPVDAAVARVRFTPDGSVVVVYAPDETIPVMAGTDVTAGGDQRHGPVVWVIPIGPAVWSAQACSVVGRPLTLQEWSTYLPDVAYQPACR